MAKPIVDMFSWNAPGNTLQDLYNWYLEGGDEDAGGGGGGTGGITNAYVGGDDGANIRLPSSYREVYPGISEAGDQWVANQELAKLGYDNPWADEANLNEAYYGDMYDVDLYGEGKQAWFNKMKENISGNPLFQGAMSAIHPFAGALMKGADYLRQYLPVNERAIMENEALGSGIALDDIGRVVRQEGIDYDDARNIFAGYNYAQIDEDTFEKRRKAIKNMSRETGAYKKRLAAINKAEDMWKKNQIKTRFIVDQKNREKAKQDFQNIVSQDALKPITVQAVSPTEVITEEDLNKDYNEWLGKTEEEKLQEELAIEILSRAKKEKIASMDDAGRGVTYPEGPNISDLLTKTPLEQMIEAESRIIDLPDPGGDNIGYNEPGPGADHGEFGPGSWMIADGGMVKDAPRRPYGKGGIVDLL